MANLLESFDVQQWARIYASHAVGHVVLPAREEKRFPLPAGYDEPIYEQILKSIGIADAQVWLQQREALEALTAGFGNALIATPTASGKSLVFQLGAIRKLRQSPGDRVLVFYPTRALNNDQRESWKKIMAAAGYAEKDLAIIDGDVPMDSRIGLLRDARVALMTPDVVHAWMMSSLDNPTIRNFIGGLSLKILDEAHLYDGVFGSYMSLLLKRIEFAQRTLNPGFRQDYHDQVIMATATLPRPESFAKRLVGRDAWIIGPEFDTSPQYQRDVFLIRTKDRQKRNVMRALIRDLGNKPETGNMLTFVDSRANADELADDVNDRLTALKSNFRFAAHRSGLTAEYRSDIENKFRSGALKGIIATPTMDVGVDFPNVRTVVMEHLPPDPGRFKQRFGRMRKGGVCIIVEEESLLIQRLGNKGLQGYIEKQPNQPLLYPTNAKIAAEQGLCFVEELKKLGVADYAQTAAQCHMPAAFLHSVADYREKDIEDLSPTQRAAMPPEDRPPHLFHSIRSVDGPMRKLRLFNPGQQKSVAVGELTQGQSLREALPGMIVYANGRKYRVRAWSKSGGLKSSILLSPLSEAERKDHIKTRALVRTTARTYLNAMRIPKGGLRMDESGFNLMAYGQFDVIRRALGFAENSALGSTHYLFDDRLQEASIRKTRKSQTIVNTPAYGPARESMHQTQGVAFRLGEVYMKDRRLRILGNIIHDAFCSAFSVSPDDVGVMVNCVNIGYGPSRMEDRRSILLYDKHPGGMGFALKAYKDFDKLAAAMMAHVKDKDPELEDIVTTFLRWHTTLSPRKTPSYEQWLRVGQPKAKKTEGQIEVYAPQSQMYWNDPKADGKRWIEIVGGAMYEGQFYYRVREVSREYNPYNIKGRVLRGALKAKSGENFTTRYAHPDTMICPEDMPTWRLGIFDTKTREYVAGEKDDRRAQRPRPDELHA